MKCWIAVVDSSRSLSLSLATPVGGKVSPVAVELGVSVEGGSEKRWSVSEWTDYFQQIPDTHLDVQGSSTVDVIAELLNGSLGLFYGSELHDTDSLGSSTFKENLGLVDLACSLEEFD